MNNKQHDRPFKLNQVAIDPIANLITRDGEILEVTPKVVQILQYFASRDGELITYQDLADNVWNGFVSEGALYQQMTQLRKVLGDNPSKPVFVKTVPRQGYRLIADVSFAEITDKPSSSQPFYSDHKKSVPTLQKARILAVLAISAVALTALYFFLTPASLNAPS